MAAIAGAGIARNAYAAKVEKEKMVKRQDEAQKAADSANDAELEKFYVEYGPDYFVPNGYTRQVWDSLTRDQRIQLANALSKGILQPYKPVNEEEAIAQAYAANKAKLNGLGYTDAVWAALPKLDKLQILQALAQDNLRPYQTPQAAVDVVATAQAVNIANGGDGSHPFPNVPPDVQAKADAATPAIVSQIQAVGVDNFNNTATKAVGQAGAMGAMFDGAGATMPGSTGDVSKVINDNANGPVKTAISQAKDDLLNTASAFGEGDAVAAALEKGSPSNIPWTPIIIGGSIVTTGLGLGLYLALSRKRG
jgi:predicted nucleic acid-binding protein